MAAKQLVSVQVVPFGQRRLTSGQGDKCSLTGGDTPLPPVGCNTNVCDAAALQGDIVELDFKRFTAQSYLDIMMADLLPTRVKVRPLLLQSLHHASGAMGASKLQASSGRPQNLHQSR